MNNRFRSLVFAVLMILTIAATAFAGVTPARLNYQGLLTDDNGQPVTASNISMTFRIWAHPYSSDPSDLKWQETILVNVVDGLFNVILGDNVPITDSVFSTSERFLGIQIGDEAEGNPRTRLVSVGYSTRVETLDGARGGVISGTIGLQPEGNNKDGEDVDLRFEIKDGSSNTLFYANEEEVYTPCLLFSGDNSRQCTATTNSGVAQGEDSGVPTSIGASVEILAEQTIETPTEGFVLVLGSCQASLDLESSSSENFSPNTIHTYASEFGVSSSATELPDDQHKLWSIKSVDPFRKASNVISVNKVFEVGPGISTFYLLAQRTEGDVDFSAENKTLTLVFIPKAYGAVSGTDPGSELIQSNGNENQNTTNVSAKTSSSEKDEIARLRSEVAELRSMLQQAIAATSKR